MQKKYVCDHCGRQFNEKNIHHKCNTGFRKRHHSFSLNPEYCEQACNINYLQVVPKNWQERFDMYMKLNKEELASMLAERDKFSFPEGCSECQMDNSTTLTTNVDYSGDFVANSAYVYSTSTEQ